MKSPQPPDNLPVASPGYREPWARGQTNPIEWGGFDLSDEDLAEFRQALEEDLGHEVDATADQVKLAAFKTIGLVMLLRKLDEEYGDRLDGQLENQ